MIALGQERLFHPNKQTRPNQHQKIEDGMKIAQLVMIPVVSFRPHEIREDELYLRPITISDRGDGALGSTGA